MLFDRIGRQHDGFPFTEADEPRLRLLRRRLGPLRGIRIVEPGCGAGNLTTRLAKWVGDAGLVVAFDCSAGMLSRACTRTAALANVRLRQASLEEIKLPTSTFDLVLCFRVWPHFKDGTRALRVACGWLRRGGRLVIVHWEGRDRLAAIHASHIATSADAFPPRSALEPAMVRHGFAVRTWIDTPDEIFIEAVRN